MAAYTNNLLVLNGATGTPITVVAADTLLTAATWTFSASSHMASEVFTEAFFGYQDALALSGTADEFALIQTKASSFFPGVLATPLLVTTVGGADTGGGIEGQPGGDLTLATGQGGTAGSGLAFAGAGGAIYIQPGRGGDGSLGDWEGGYGGAVYLSGGQGGIGTLDTSGGFGGDVNISGGAGGSLGSGVVTEGYGGGVYIRGGDGFEFGDVVLGDVTTGSVFVGSNLGGASFAHFFPPVVLHPLAGTPIIGGNAGMLYSKDVAGITQLFYQTDDDTEYQLTPPGGGGGAVLTSDFTLEAATAAVVGQVFSIQAAVSPRVLLPATNVSASNLARAVAVSTTVLVAGGTGPFETLAGRPIPVLMDAVPATGDIGAVVYLGVAGQGTLTAPSLSGTSVVELGVLASAPGSNVPDVVWNPRFVALLP